MVKKKKKLSSICRQMDNSPSNERGNLERSAPSCEALIDINTLSGRSRGLSSVNARETQAEAARSCRCYMNGTGEAGGRKKHHRQREEEDVKGR